MVRSFDQDSTFSHVLSVDVLDRRIEERVENDVKKIVLRTARLILKQGSLPSWAPQGIIKNTQSWVLEESVVDLNPRDSELPRTMSVWTQNLDHTTVMTVTDRMRFTERPDDTLCSSHGDVISSVGLAVVRGRIEKFGYKRYIAHHATAREGIIWTIQHLPQILKSGITADALDAPKSLSRRRRLLHALRPPFLDGYPLGPFQWIRKKWRQLRGKETPLLSV
ncbi:aminodeoxychorismate lyase [Malassezia cuniculi]|uniref:Aminodeoxychorismate lyase n=1 Tax=Malassezia cuniculi TaxID=948313 RepID=A0AAF0EYU5_9BASI|nr:aminodeoxychorismate lyase [Malassezia cuniculi]